MEKINRDILKNITILYVEDEDSISEQVKYFFSKFVKKFYIARNGEEGLELYKEINPDIIITDIQMPKMNGLDMIRQIEDKNIPIIITTAYSDSEYFLKAIDLKIDKFVIKPINLVELIHDVQRLVLENHLQDKLYEKDTLLQIVDENVLISITDINGKILDVSEAFCNFSGYTKIDLIGNTHSILKHPETKNSFYERLWSEILSGRKFVSEVKNLNKNGEDIWTKVSITPLFKDNEIIKFIAIRHDITNKKKLEALSIEDPLTGIYNRRYFNNVLNKEIRRVKREDGIIGLLIIDIDDFKKYNDSFGHPMGDELLVKIAKTFKSCLLRSTDYLFRIGGEEFCIIFSGQSIEESLAYSNMIVKKIEDLNILQKSGDKVTVSAGLIVQNSEYLTDELTLYKYSDEALYQAKEKGKNRVILSSKSK